MPPAGCLALARTPYEPAIRVADLLPFVRTGGVGRAGFATLQGCRRPQRGVVLKRIVQQPIGRELGRLRVRQLERMALSDLHAHRSWLDLQSPDNRARHRYRGEGFVDRACLRESMRPSSVAADGPAGVVVTRLRGRQVDARLTVGQGPAP